MADYTDLKRRLRDPMEMDYNPEIAEEAADAIDALESDLKSEGRATDNALDNMDAALAKITQLRAEIASLGRELNTARYGEPDFGWELHKAAMSDLKAEVERLTTQEARLIHLLRYLQDCDLKPNAQKAIRDVIGAKR